MCSFILIRRILSTLTPHHGTCAQYFGDISVLLKRPEPATIRVSSLKVGHWRRLVILIIVDDEGCGEGRRSNIRFVHPFSQAVLWRIHKSNVPKLSQSIVDVSETRRVGGSSDVGLCKR